MRVVTSFLVIGVLLTTVAGRAQAQTERDVCLSGTGEAATKACSRALRSTPSNTLLIAALVYHLNEAGRHEEARREVESALRRRPGEAKLEQLLALTDSYIEEEQRSREAAGAAVPSDRARQRFDRLMCESQSGEPALDACRKVLRNEPDDSAALLARIGFLLYEQGRYPEAVGSLERAVALNSADASLRREVESVLNSIKGEQAAACEQTIEFDPETGTFVDVSGC